VHEDVPVVDLPSKRESICAFQRVGVTTVDGSSAGRAYVSRVRDWFDVVTAEGVWEQAAAYEREHTVALGDAFTLATATEKDAVAYCGADGDFGDVDVPVKRFRTEGV